MDRRIIRLLASVTAAGAVALAGCTSDQVDSSEVPESTPPAPHSPAPPKSESLEEPAPDSLEGQVRDLVRCLNDRGWETEILPGSNTYRTVVPPEQHDQYSADIEECNIEIGVDLSRPQVTPEEASELYDVLLGVADCVRDLGFAVPDPPSRQAFVEDVVSTTVPDWHPYDVVFESGNQNDIQLVESECPVE